jgi:hypothetical protein
MTYTINTNTTFNSLEITFEHKPSEKVLEALKALRFRWHNAKKLWYGFATDTAVISAIQNAEQEENPLATGTIYSDGYLGAIKTDGINSNKHLYGKDLSEAIRNHLKQAGIKGVTVSCKSYAGGQHLYLKIKFNPESDIIPFEDYLAQYYVSPSRWYYYNDGGKWAASIHGENYYTLGAQEQEEMRVKFAEYDYNKIANGQNLNEFHLTAASYPEFTEDFFKKITEINAIVNSYRYDDSNSQVDYFDTNFYYDRITVPATK